ncbi:glycoside hydrolase family 3 N-terminal domain-containing protein [Conexibacter sp. DBS9H8]|uniref:glycoside hydrolase family 3 N-terminal domain-containing protein n=1 Tax=Conexibacter sp. DBS9H8 TaxID=2937801 RepID=UPI002010C4A6|nr:glycoside hydrolase family 3 N-terminal domain-containing protein [Conexibacter sp. DBS9H8]
MAALVGGLLLALAAAVASGGETRPAPVRNRASMGEAPRVGSLTPAAALAIAGQHVIDAYAGPNPPPSLIAAIRAGQTAGVILFSPNVADPAALHRAVAAMQAAASASPEHRPLLILTDQEGGLVRRLPGAPALSEQAIGARPDRLALAAQAGAGAAATLRRAGVNVNLAPVLDVYRSPGNFIDQYGRSYSQNPAVVSRLGAQFIHAQQADRIAATAKHFPGLGSATRAQDTDTVPVRLDVPLSELRTVDEAPYVAAIRAGVRLVMVSWAVYPALDPARPAGLSSRVIGGELRGRLHFRGVTITDAIEAGALRGYGGVGARSVLATAAGADLILACAPTPPANTPAIGHAAVSAIAAALLEHHLNLTALEDSGARVSALRAWIRP